jgi:hypothetical protein
MIRQLELEQNQEIEVPQNDGLWNRLFGRNNQVQTPSAPPLSGTAPPPPNGFTEAF